MQHHQPRIKPLRQFVIAATGLVEKLHSERRLLDALGSHLAELVLRDDWLPSECSRRPADRGGEHLLYADPLDRFSVTSLLLGAGEATPLRKSTSWEVCAGLRGARATQTFVRQADGSLLAHGEPATWRPCQVEAVSKVVAPIHRTRNLMNDDVCISIHVRGAACGYVVEDDADGAMRFGRQLPLARRPNIWSLI